MDRTRRGGGVGEGANLGLGDAHGERRGRATSSVGLTVSHSDEAPSGILGKLVSNLPDGRKSSAPESYGSRPESITLQEGRYRRPPPERVGGVTEDAVRGEDYEVVDGPSFGIGTLVGVLLAIATLGGAYLTVNKLSQGPVAPREGAVRMPATDRS